MCKSGYAQRHCHRTTHALKTASLILPVLAATLLLAVLAITIGMHVVHHFIIDFALDCFASPSKSISVSISISL